MEIAMRRTSISSAIIALLLCGQAFGQVMPSPDENHAEFFEQLLRRNDNLRDVAFTVGEERAVFLKGRLDLRWIDDQSLDRILGSVYAAVERCFQSAVRVGFASRFASPS